MNSLAFGQSILTFWFVLIIKLCNCGKIISSPRLTDWGRWGSWEYCPAGTYVTGLQIYNHASQGILWDDRGLTGIKLFCNPFGVKGESHSIKSDTDNVGKWGRKHFCSGRMTGFQMRHEPYRSVFVDDTAASNIRMFCDDSSTSYIEAEGNSFGKWTEKRLCSSKEYVCGIQTQIDRSGSWDSTGLNNVNMKCCDIPSPIGNCVPETTWTLAASCSASVNESKKVCNYSRRKGISFSNGKTNPFTIMVMKAGYDLNALKQPFHLKFMNSKTMQYSAIYKEDSADDYWVHSQKDIWEPETSVLASLTATKGQRILIYQVFGKCGLLQVWGSKTKTIEYTKVRGRESRKITYSDFNSYTGLYYSNQLQSLK